MIQSKDVAHSMKISIIIPVYNIDIQKFIFCMKSISGQTYSDYEVIIIDDGSSQENAKELDEAVLHFRASTVYHIMNHGVSYARNAGMKLAQGEYILFVDGDDILSPIALESGARAILETKADMAIGRILQTSREKIETDEKQQIVTGRYEVLNSASDIQKFEAHIFSKKCAEWGVDDKGTMFNGEGCWAHLIRKEIAMDFPFIEKLAVAEDTIWGIQVLEGQKNIKICLVEDLWYFYIQNPDSVMNKYNDKVADSITSALEILTPVMAVKESWMYEVYIHWVFIKMKQILNQYYLSAELHMSLYTKMYSLRKLMRKKIWVDTFRYARELKLKEKMKLLLYRTALIILIRCLWKGSPHGRQV